jgi:hypothetical protein
MLRKAILFELRNPIFLKNRISQTSFRRLEIRFKKKSLKHLGNIMRNISYLIGN